MKKSITFLAALVSLVAVDARFDDDDVDDAVGAEEDDDEDVVDFDVVEPFELDCFDSFLIIFVSFEGSNTFLVVLIFVGFNTALLVVLFSEFDGTLLVASDIFEFDEL